jgi:hypothetical protein
MENVVTKAIELDGDSLENPVFVNHKRGRNWGAVLSGKNAANMHRSFLRSKGATIDLDPVTVGDVIEIAGDYTSSGGRFDPNRLYWRVLAKTDDEMTVEVHSTAARALKAARLAAKVEGVAEAA